MPHFEECPVCGGLAESFTTPDEFHFMCCECGKEFDIDSNWETFFCRVIFKGGTTHRTNVNTRDLMRALVEVETEARMLYKGKEIIGIHAEKPK